MEMLRQNGAKFEIGAIDPSFCRKVTFCCKGRMERYQVVMMSTESSPGPAIWPATPPACYRAMPVQSLEPGTPASLLGSLFTIALALPRALVRAPALIRRRV
jgi:hypothetical protein